MQLIMRLFSRSLITSEMPRVAVDIETEVVLDCGSAAQSAKASQVTSAPLHSKLHTLPLGRHHSLAVSMSNPNVFSL